MKRKKMTLISLCIMITMLICCESLVTADNSNSGTATTSQTIDATGMWYPTPGRFIYNNGNVNGSHITFNIDETSGTITDYTVNVTVYPAILYPSPLNSKPYIQPSNIAPNITSEKKTIFSSIQIRDFERAAAPIAFADYLVFLGMNTLMKCVDQEGGVLHYATSTRPATIVLHAVAGSNITQPSNDVYTILPEKIDNESGTNASEQPEQPPIMEEGSSFWRTVYVKSDNVTASISIYNGTVTVHSDTITVNLSAYSYLDVYAWVEYPMPVAMNDYWYSDLNIQPEKSVIENAKNSGVITAEGWYTANGTIQSVMQPQPNSNTGAMQTTNANLYKYNDPTFSMSFNQISANGIDVIVDSQIATGRIVIINIDKAALQTTSVEQLLVKMDSAQISKAETLQDLMEKAEKKDAQAGCYALEGEHLTTVFVYVPHFSSHTISISSLTSEGIAVSNLVLPLLLSVLFLCFSLGGILLKRRKQQDDF